MHQSQKIQAYLETLSKFPKVMQNYPVQVTDEMMELYLEVISYSAVIHLGFLS